jgi:hypothetical protein
MCIKFYLENLKGRDQLGDRYRWDDYIKISLKEVGYEVVNWSHLAEDRDHWQPTVNIVMNLWIP